MKKAPIMNGAVMLDKVVGEIQEGLINNIDWLDCAFGIAQRLVKEVHGKRIIMPGVYTGGKGANDYIDASPDSHLGNFVFFEAGEPQILDWQTGRQVDFKTPIAIIFWFDMRRIKGVDNNRNLESVKAEIIKTLNGRNGFILKNGRLTINRCFERAENIYKGYTLEEVDNQFLMHPFGGFRFEGTLEYEEIC